MESDLNIKVDRYLIDGCMRCNYGATPQCKVNRWRGELELLRQIVLETGLKEELKWGVPVYTHNGKNVVTLNALKDSANIGFFKGALLTDEYGILQQQGNLQSDRLIKFTTSSAILTIKDVLIAYVMEAIAIEESGRKVVFKNTPEPIPAELVQALDEDPGFKKAFYALTSGRQRGYIIHFSQPKQAQTRISRIEKYKEQIMKGVGLHDRYSR